MQRLRLSLYDEDKMKMLHSNVEKHSAIDTQMHTRYEDDIYQSYQENIEIRANLLKCRFIECMSNVNTLQKQTLDLSFEQKNCSKQNVLILNKFFCYRNKMDLKVANK